MEAMCVNAEVLGVSCRCDRPFWRDMGWSDSETDIYVARLK
jgi:hypothetical protein